MNEVSHAHAHDSQGAISGLRDVGPWEMPELDANRLAVRLDSIARLGNRFGGTSGEARCRDFLLDEFAKARLSRVRGEEFRYLAYEPRRAACAIVGGDWTAACAPLQSTADGVAEGVAVYLGACEEKDIAAIEGAGVSLRGKVAVIRSSWTFLAAPLLEGKGIAALVNISEAPPDVVPHFTARLYPSPLRAPWDGRVFPFPGVTVEAAAGQRLLSLMSIGQMRLRVEHRAAYVEKTATNIVGEITGDVTPDERVILAAHYDTQLEGPGAQDNASGIAVLLEVASSWSRLRLPRTVVFIATALEELALWGAHAYVASHMEDHERTLGMINIDAPGAPLPGTRSLFADPSMAGFARESASRMRWDAEAEFDASQYPTGDHIPFIDSGIPACWLFRTLPKSPYYHTSRDTTEFVSIPLMKESGSASAYIAFRLAHLPQPGLGRSRPARRWVEALSPR